ncbi:hypothetical protein WOLCODRAFT_134397 [Wolfiporia cocos MD-104 SS10]|uniref:Uncharacterized protein n=1 Tax=Wolfiporia cocos (strain MD-104) TaxID=742152 RepID=A0A2H3JLM9_WOLCO|nr:hypothetical protein WOLCODRAFT_134397 [Wolfiporia cocos MD-104 SS10]
MYKLLRRISSSFFPRPDRPWNEDATSNAPQIGQKRRLSSTEPDEGPSASSTLKKRRGDTFESTGGLPPPPESPTRPGRETEEVKEVTEGVRDVELDEEAVPTEPSTPTPEEAAAVPLPESPSGIQFVHDPADALEDAPSDGSSAGDAEAIKPLVTTAEEPESMPLVEEVVAVDAVEVNASEEEEQESPGPSTVAEKQVEEEEEEIPGLTAASSQTDGSSAPATPSVSSSRDATPSIAAPTPAVPAIPIAI